MSEPTYSLRMVDVLPEWQEHDRKPFRCGKCGQWCEDGDGKWISRGIGPGHFMAAHRECPRKPLRWWRG